MTLAVIFIPVIAAFALLIVNDKKIQSVIAFLAAILTFVASLFLSNANPISKLWIPGFNSYFELNPLGAASVLVLVASLVMIPTILYASRQIEENTGSFLALLLFMQAGLNGIFLAKDLVLFYLFWEATLIPSLLMLGIWGRKNRRKAVVKYLIYAVGGSFFMLISILAIKPLSGAISYRFADLYAVTPKLPVQTQIWLFLGFSAAFLVKQPIWPLHSWLVSFNEENHPSGVADVMGTLYKVGAFGFFAWAMPLLPDAAKAVSPILMVFAALSAVYAIVLATAQTNLKRALAYASLSHMGIVGMGIFALNIIGSNGAVFLLAAQMLSTGGLFLITGMLYERRQSFEMDDYGGIAKSAPMLAAFALLIIFTSIGVPGLANFPGEFMSLMGAFQTSVGSTAVAALAVIGAGVFGVNLYQKIFQAHERHRVADLDRLELIVLIPIIAGIIWLGLAPNLELAKIELQSRLINPIVQLTEAADGLGDSQ